MIAMNLDIAPNLALNAIEAMKIAISKIDPKATLTFANEMDESVANELDARIKRYKSGKMKFKSLDEAKNMVNAIFESNK